jgi:hypothetical protein
MSLYSTDLEKMLKALKDFYETWVNSLAYPDNVQNLYAKCAGSRSWSHLQVKGLRLRFHVRSLSSKSHDFKAPCVTYIYIYILKSFAFFFLPPKMTMLVFANGAL